MGEAPVRLDTRYGDCSTHREKQMRSRFGRGLFTIGVALLLGGARSDAARRPQTRPDPPPPDVSYDTRLLVVAPHPDDEVLAAGGLMQHVLAAGGQVRVVYLTNGDGYRDGVRLEEREARPKPKDFRG